MIVKLLTEHYLEFLSLKGGCICMHRKWQSKSVYASMVAWSTSQYASEN